MLPPCRHMALFQRRYDVVRHRIDTETTLCVYGVKCFRKKLFSRKKYNTFLQKSNFTKSPILLPLSFILRNIPYSEKLYIPENHENNPVMLHKISVLLYFFQSKTVGPFGVIFFWGRFQSPPTSDSIKLCQFSCPLSFPPYL